MISQLEIKNFQSHKNSVLNFVPGINIILGPSDQGKSAIIRAIRWIAENQPLGEEFRSDWGGDTECSITTDDEIKATRLKTKTKNQYLLSEYKDPFEGFKQSVPEPIKQALNLSDINFQFQMDTPFLISKSAPDVTRYINELCHLESIDRAYKNIKAEINRWKTKADQRKIDIEESEKQIKELSWIDKADGKLTCIETKERLLNTKKNNADQIESLIEQARDVQKELDTYPDLAALRVKLDKAMVIHAELKKHRENANRVDQIIQSGRRLENKILKLGKNIVSYKQEFKKLMPRQCPLCGKG